MNMGEEQEYLNRLVDKQQLREYLETKLGEVDTFRVKRHQEGHSNETLFITFGEKELVLRRPPPGKTADTAHDVLREYRIISTLQETDVPVPATVLSTTDHSIIGSDFYIMEKVEGDVIRSHESDWITTAPQRERIGYELVEKLAQIHTVDYEAIGLDDIGKPEGYTERQVDRWQQQLKWAFEITSDKREIPKLHDIGEWLQDNIPNSTKHALVHGDFSIDNVMYAPGSDPEIISVFDWEMSTLGDPALDLAWLIVYWRDPGDPEPAVPEFVPDFVETKEYPTRTELVTQYEQITGNTFRHRRFYRTLAVYKIAALGEMFYRRHLEGNSDDPVYPAMEDGVPKLADRCSRIIDGEEPL
jgi:aminoglycoside phosphotransferase (APT) family kinase protein